MSNNLNSYGFSAVGLRFIPTDEELVGYFLLRKVVGVPIPETFILECDLYGKENPWELWEKYNNWVTINPTDGSQDLYFFTKLKRKTPNTIRVERRVGIGAWQGEDGKNNIMSSTVSHICIGSKKRFRFEKSGTHHDGEWIMHEYSLNASLLPADFSQSIVNELVLCRIRKNEHVSTDGNNKNDNKRRKSPKQDKIDHSLNASLLPPNTPNTMVNELVLCQMRKNEYVSTNQSNKNDKKRKKSSEQDNVDQSQCKSKKLRQQDLELFQNHLEPDNTLFSKQELFLNDSSSERALLNSTESDKMEATGLNENDLYSLEMDEEIQIFAMDLERELLEFDQKTQSEVLENSNKIQEKTYTQEDDFDVLIDIDELLNLPEDSFDELGDILQRI